MAPHSGPLKGRAACGDLGEVPADADAEPLDDEEIDAASEALRATRVGWADVGGLATCDIFTTIVCGAWTASNRGSRVRQRHGMPAPRIVMHGVDAMGYTTRRSTR